MCKQIAPDRREIRRVGMPDGEVLHLLADVATGVPDPYVTRFILATLRQSGSISGTIKRALEGVRIGLNFLDDRGIELERIPLNPVHIRTR